MMKGNEQKGQIRTNVVWDSVPTRCDNSESNLNLVQIPQCNVDRVVREGQSLMVETPRTGEKVNKMVAPMLGNVAEMSEVGDVGTVSMSTKKKGIIMRFWMIWEMML